MPDKETFGDILRKTQTVKAPSKPKEEPSKELNEFPWDRLADESTKAYELFCFYRDYGPTRTYTAVQRKYSGVEFDLTPTTLRTYGKKFNWPMRAQAYDDHIMAQEQSQNEKLILKFKKKRAKQAQKMMDKYFELMETEDSELLTSKEKRERFKLGFDLFNEIFQLDKDKKVEHSGSVTIVFGDEVKDV
jgi:hypothetical protein